MAETTREGFSKTMEYSTNQCQESQWKESKGSDNRGKTSNSWSLPADSRSHKLRRTLFTMEFLHKASNQESNTREAKELSHSEGGSFEEAVHDDGKKKKVPSTYDKYYIHNKKQQNREIHDRSLGLFNTSKTISTHVINVGGNERDGFRIEGERYENNERDGVIRGDKEDQKPLKIEETRKKPKTNKGKKKKNKKKSILF
ncbi:unnamed protein product [Rhizophagus irregularis]|nr:unnamed protein product [Rhizophagus irregularis]